MHINHVNVSIQIHYWLYYGLSPAWCQVIIWANAVLFNEPLEIILVKFESNETIYVQENLFKNVVCKMVAILFQPHVLTR